MVLFYVYFKKVCKWFNVNYLCLIKLNNSFWFSFFCAIVACKWHKINFLYASKLHKLS